MIIETFKIGLDYYLYDANANKLVNIAPETFEILEGNCLPSNIYGNEKKLVGKLKRKGLLAKNKLKNIGNPLNPLLPSLLESKLQMLSLQITQRCNLRCAYCQYSGFLYNNREHSDVSMSRELAIKTVDFFLHHSKNNYEIYIGFYGGEPLLEFDLIEYVTNYVMSLNLNRVVNFTITTNGTLLDEKMIDFFIRNEFKLSISLDGPSNVHDTYRKDYNGNGTYEKVVKWVEYLKNRNPQFFEKNVTFNSVNYNYKNKKEISDFFMENNYKVESITLSDLYTNFNKKYIDDVFSEYERLKLILRLKGCKKFNSVFLSEFIFAKRIKVSMDRTNGNLPIIFHPSGPCIPGVKRLFVNVKGDFYPCERSNELCEQLCIGNINSGFNIAKIIRLFNIAKCTEDECKNCWAIRFCYSCALSAVDSKTLTITKEKRLSMCKYRKMKIMKAFEMIHWLEKLGCNWDDL